MSYIRFGESPDSLYVFGSSTGVEFMRGASGSDFIIPHEDWERAVLEWLDLEETAGPVSITEEWRDGSYKVVLRYQEHEVEMWMVTWCYIIDRYRFDDRFKYMRWRDIGRMIVKRLIRKS